MKTALPSLIFEITSRCNLACRYCYNVWKAPGAAPPAQSGYAQAKRTLKRLFSVADVQHVTFSGGEPFLAERFAELVLFCRMRGKSVTIISNGTVATAGQYQEVVDLGVGLFEFPLHAPEPSAHEAMTGRSGSWELSRRSIEQVLGLGADVVVALIVSKLNANRVGETLRFVHGLGVRRVMLNRFNIGGRGIAERAALTPSREQLASAFADADAAAGDLGLSITSNVCTPYCFLDPAAFRRIGFATCTTDVRRRPLTLDTDGNLRFCNHSPVVLGNIFQHAPEAMLSSAYVGLWTDAVPLRCRGCDRWARCQGGCRAASEQVGRTVWQTDPLLDERDAR